MQSGRSASHVEGEREAIPWRDPSLPENVWAAAESLIQIAGVEPDVVLDRIYELLKEAGPDADFGDVILAELDRHLELQQAETRRLQQELEKNDEEIARLRRRVRARESFFAARTGDWEGFAASRASRRHERRASDDFRDDT